MNNYFFKDKVWMVVAILLLIACVGIYLKSSNQDAKPYNPLGTYSQQVVDLPTHPLDPSSATGQAFPTAIIKTGSEIIPIHENKCNLTRSPVKTSFAYSWHLVNPDVGLSVDGPDQESADNVEVAAGCSITNFSFPVPIGVRAVLDSLKKQGITRSVWQLHDQETPVHEAPVSTKFYTSQEFIIDYQAG